MDGATHASIPDDGLSRPFLFLGKVAGAVHASFTDMALLADQIGIDTGAGLPGARSLDITRAYVRAFFDQHLRSKPQALLDQPSPRYPEVTFGAPE